MAGVDLVRVGTLRYEARGIDVDACQVVAVAKARGFFGDEPKLIVKLVEIEPELVMADSTVVTWVAHCEARAPHEGPDA